MKERLQAIGQNLLPSVAYGDAAGLPTETMSVEKIKIEYGVVTQLLPPVHNPFYERDFPAGSWSDDTQLSLVVARSLIANAGFDLDDMAKMHTEAYHETPQVAKADGQSAARGWGGATTRSVERLIGGVLPTESGEKGGAGNGVIMKLAPLVYWQAARQLSLGERYQQYDKLTAMTHDSPVARAASRVHGDMLGHLMENGYERNHFLTCLAQSLEEHEAVCQTQELSDAVGFLSNSGGFSNSVILHNTDGKGFYVPQTIAMAYAAFMEHPTDFTRAVYKAVNLGGDTDSTASIVATMVCAATADNYVRPLDFDKIHALARVSATSVRLSQVALQGPQAGC